MSKELKGKNLFEYNGIICTDNIPKNIFISITKEQYIEYMQLKKEIEKQKDLYEKLLNGYNERVKEIENSISKDKIKEIIENHYPDVAISKLYELLEV